jgi:phage antirepressor YoqD-like protein
MGNLEVFNYGGNNITFQIGKEDVMINASQMAKPFGKKPNDYLRLLSTKQLIKAIARKSRISDNQVVTTKQGSIENGGGTWMHEDLALDHAQWLHIDFKLWCNDRLKELLKNGFTATTQKLDELLENPDLIIQLATKLKSERLEKERLQTQTKLQTEQLKLQAPKIQYCDSVLKSKSTYNTTQIAKELGISASVLNKILKRDNVQYRQNGTWLLYSKYQNSGYTKTKTYSYTDTDGDTRTSMLTVWTERGRAFIHHKITKKEIA